MLLSLPSAFGLVGWDANRDANLDPVPAVEAVDLQLEQPSLLELLPGVEQQHPLLESEQQQDLYVQRATSAQGDINVDNLYCGALTNPDGDVVVSGDLCASSSLSPQHHSSKTALCASPQVQRWPRDRRPAREQLLPRAEHRGRHAGDARHAVRRQPRCQRQPHSASEHELRRGRGGGDAAVGVRLPADV